MGGLSSGVLPSSYTGFALERGLLDLFSLRIKLGLLYSLLGRGIKLSGGVKDSVVVNDHQVSEFVVFVPCTWLRSRWLREADPSHWQMCGRLNLVVAQPVD